jgi:riboflavin kinase/FMN adenylyltransferase
MEKSFSIAGRVIQGEKKGRELGFPTANIDRRIMRQEKSKLPHGIYGGVVSLGTKKYKAGIVIGPLDKKGFPKIEAHLIGFSGDLYGKMLEVQALFFLRKFKHYKSEAVLAKDIQADIKKITNHSIWKKLKL